MRRHLEARKATVLDATDTVTNAMFVQVADDQAAALAEIPGVKRVYPVRTLKLFLDRAVVLHRVAEAWSRPGGDRGGEGIKIGIIDTGIEVGHPSFNDPSLQAPPGFPIAPGTGDMASTNAKVIVARSYVNLLDSRDPDPSARDRVGHGTALAMAAAGVRMAGPLATIVGMAPKAFLGNYKVFGSPGANDSTNDSAVLKALDDAVADGMDVVSMSFGTSIATRLEDDVEVQAIDRATKAGVIVVVAAGNTGSDLSTIASPGTAPSAITVGATTSDRTFGMTVDVPGLPSVFAIPGGAVPSVPITAPLADVAALDTNGLGCAAFPAASLTGKIAVIGRGTCTFEIKINNAQRAGALAALIYAAESAPAPIAMAVGAATLPAEMVSSQDGAAIRGAIAANPSLVATMHFTRGPVAMKPNVITDFSGAGPNVDASIKPDIVALGGDVYTATQTLDPRGDMYDKDGFILVDGTSFSTPIVAGAAALLKGARPGLTVEQYRSLLINSAAHLDTIIQREGAGLLDSAASLDSTAAMSPVSLGLGIGSSDMTASRTLKITNTGAVADTFTIGSVLTGGALAASLPLSSIRLEAGQSGTVTVNFRGAALAGGAHEGLITVAAGSTGQESRVPYWYAVKSAPASINIVDAITSGRRGSRQQEAAYFRVTDIAGVALTDAASEVTVVSGGGDVTAVKSLDSEAPGIFAVDVILGVVAGPNVFRVKAGGVTTEFTITGR
ncbi:MAG: S8 family serine peptidase [Bryobacteraceae bacterium]